MLIFQLTKAVAQYNDVMVTTHEVAMAGKLMARTDSCWQMMTRNDSFLHKLLEM